METIEKGAPTTRQILCEFHVTCPDVDIDFILSLFRAFRSLNLSLSTVGQVYVVLTDSKNMQAGILKKSKNP